MSETMRTIATLPCGYVAPDIASRDAYTSEQVDYCKNRLTQFGPNESVQDSWATTYTAGSHTGNDEISFGGNIWSKNRANGLYVHRYGGYGGDAISRVGPTGHSLTGINDIEGGVWDTTSTGTHLPNVIGLSWMYRAASQDEPSHSGANSARVEKLSLIYTTSNRLMYAYPLNVKAHANSGTLGTSYSTTEDKYFAYRLPDEAWLAVTRVSDPLYFMGVIIAWNLNHGVGSQTLSGVVFNGAPIIADSATQGSIFDDWNNTSRLHMTVKDSQTNTSTLASSSTTMFPLQPSG